MPVNDSDLQMISVIERVCSVFSLLGCLFIILTFCLSNLFHKPINRLVFYASFGNIVCNVATLMSTSFTGDPEGKGCQSQAFLIQMLMPADACWALAMAINVYLTFYRRFDLASLQNIEPYYLLFCYGVPFIPALVFLFVKDAEGRMPYGDATLWCWLSDDWRIYRISTFYAPVWLLIFVTFTIYICAGVTILQWRKQVRDLESSTLTTSRGRPGIETMKTTEVAVVRTEVGDVSPVEQPEPAATYSIHISAQPRRSVWDTPGDIEEVATNTDPSTAQQQPNLRTRTWRQSNRTMISYARSAALFFTAMLITWIPSSANRVQGLISGENSRPLLIMSAFVLPLQGFWNALIYILASRGACREYFSSFRSSRHKDAAEFVNLGGGWKGNDQSRLFGGNRHHRSQDDSDSVTVLARNEPDRASS